MKRYPDVETNEHGEGVMRWGVIPMQFPFINYGMELYKRQYTDKHVTLSKCMCMRASGASELRKFWHFHTLKLLFLSIFCRYIENKPGLNFIWGGKRPPKPPHQYARSNIHRFQSSFNQHVSIAKVHEWEYNHLTRKQTEMILCLVFLCVNDGAFNIYFYRRTGFYDYTSFIFLKNCSLWKKTVDFVFVFNFCKWWSIQLYIFVRKDKVLWQYFFYILLLFALKKIQISNASVNIFFFFWNES